MPLAGRGRASVTPSSPWTIPSGQPQEMPSQTRSLNPIGRIQSPRVRLPLVGPEDHEAAVIEDEFALVRPIDGVDLTNFRPDRNAAAGGALPKVAGTTR